MNIRDIAKIVGVSSTTVSRVINCSGYVKEETKKKILQVIQETGYVPNEVARSLSSRESSGIAVLVPDITNEFFSALIRGIGSVAEEEGYRLILCDTAEDMNKEHNALSEVERQYLSGIIIAPVSEQDAETYHRLAELEKKNISVVLADREVYGGELDGVFVDNVKGAYEGVHALIREGHRKIAIIAGPDTSLPGRERLIGYKEALRDAGLKVKEEYIVFGDFQIDKAYERTRELLALEEAPTAIFTSNNKTTLGALKYFTENHIKIGRDISILGFDQIDALKFIAYPLSTVERDAEFQGKETMRALISKLKNKGNTGIKKKILVPHKVILRGSEKCKKLQEK